MYGETTERQIANVLDRLDREARQMMLYWMAKYYDLTLLPPGGQVREEWRVVYGLGEVLVWSHCRDQAEADRDLATAKQEGWPGATKETRTVTTHANGTTVTTKWAAPALSGTGEDKG